MTDLTEIRYEGLKRMECRTGYNRRVKMYYVEIVDPDSQDNMRVYLSAKDFRELGQSMVDYIK